MPTIATWNVNSINARLEIVLAWLRTAAPDIVLLQEIKCTDEPSRGSPSSSWATRRWSTARRATTAWPS